MQVNPSCKCICFLLKIMTLGPYPALRPRKAYTSQFSHQHAVPNSESFRNFTFFSLIIFQSHPIVQLSNPHLLPISFAQCFPPHQTPAHEPNYPYQDLPTSQILSMYLRMHVSTSVIAPFQFKNSNNESGLFLRCNT
jgi:hypothetical protein